MKFIIMQFPPRAIFLPFRSKYKESVQVRVALKHFVTGKVFTMSGC